MYARPLQCHWPSKTVFLAIYSRKHNLILWHMHTYVDRLYEYILFGLFESCRRCRLIARVVHEKLKWNFFLCPCSSAAGSFDSLCSCYSCSILWNSVVSQRGRCNFGASWLGLFKVGTPSAIIAVIARRLESLNWIERILDSDACWFCFDVDAWWLRQWFTYTQTLLWGWMHF